LEVDLKSSYQSYYCYGGCYESIVDYAVDVAHLSVDHVIDCDCDYDFDYEYEYFSLQAIKQMMSVYLILNSWRRNQLKFFFCLILYFDIVQLF